eukprot:TRINITY_DN11049_c0_g1_i8.p1 TRINITY_DN11049_c0_g1~~TRINITY_DN11049_c0_g1_i8.p1  ORF type:complete len:148 (+),score=29.49 TRINITY_DN11049_c0_g1_i8:3-446(+)
MLVIFLYLQLLLHCLLLVVIVFILFYCLVYSVFILCCFFFFFQAEDGIRDVERSRGLGDVYKRQVSTQSTWDDIKAYKSLIKTLELLAFKCQHYRLNTFISGWKCDRKYFTSKMTLSEDGLTYGNSASNGYPAIIGDTPLELSLIHI